MRSFRVHNGVPLSRTAVRDPRSLSNVGVDTGNIASIFARKPSTPPPANWVQPISDNQVHDWRPLPDALQSLSEHQT
jgi:hypothetical protein